MSLPTHVKALIEQGDKLFGGRAPFLSLLQEIADNFYPQRADFTVTRSLGTEFADHLQSSIPLLVCRDLGDSLGGMLRPTSKEWMFMRADREVDHDGRAWLEWATGVQKRATYDRKAMFTRATKEGDHDYVAFGQAVLSVEMSSDLDHLLYRTWHIRDVAWCEGADGSIDTVHRKRKPTISDLNRLFKGNIHQTLKDKVNKEPYCEVECRHIVVPTYLYDDTSFKRFPFVSLYVDVANQFVMEEVGQWTFPYVIPRWQTVSGSQYAYSPATICALPDARLIQSMTLTLLEAGEKAVSPPMIGVQEAIRSNLELFAGGFTAVDAAYDERMGDVLRPLTIDKSGIPFGMEMRADLRATLAEAFYLDKLNLPPVGGGDMTAYEVGARIQQHIRHVLPLFEPMEADYNGALCERTFDLLLRNGAFGPVDQIPKSLRGQEITFRFESPLNEAVEKEKANTFKQAAELISIAVGADESARNVVDAKIALRDSLRGLGVPAVWTRSPEQVQAMEEAEAQQAAQQEMLSTMQQGAAIVKDLSSASV